MKFKNTTSTALEQMPTDDSIVVTTDTSLVGYCVDNVLYKANKPEWHIVHKPNIGLIRDGVLNSFYANELDFGNNNGAGTAQAYQAEGAYRLGHSNPFEVAWIRWKIDLDKVDYVDVKWQLVFGHDTLILRITDKTLSPTSCNGNDFIYDSYQLYTESISAKEYTFDLSQITGVHWMYIWTNYPVSSYNLLDMELREADE